MARVLIGNVRQPTDELLEFFAPAGYGLGELGSSMRTSTASDVDSFKRTGWAVYYNSDYVNLLESAPNSHGCAIYTEMFGWNYGRQTAWTLNGDCLQRNYLSSVWQPWEWVKPLMILGVEYRTTERWNGRPVYTMLVDCGTTVEGTTTKAIPFAGTPIRHSASAGGLVSPYRPNGSDVYRFEVYVDGSNITLTVGSGEAGKNAFAQIWYVKA